MALGRCKECGKEVSADSKTCPHCGKAQPTSGLLSSVWSRFRALPVKVQVAIAGVVLLVGLISSSSENRARWS
jgi:hypothetical protein